jgi:glycosyltransferase involved in cell wall biosynthesis
MYRVLMLSSVPLAAPWNGADKNLARILVHYDQENHYLVQTDSAEPWPTRRVMAIRERDVSPMPTTVQKLRMLDLIRRYAHQVDLIHIVASLRRPTLQSGLILRTMRHAFQKPVVHTAPSLGDLPLTSHRLFGDATVVVSAYSYEQLQRHGVRKARVVYPPIDMERLRPAEDLAALARELRLGSRAVLYPAHYGPHSGIAEIIMAFAQLPAELDDAVLVLACRTHKHQNPAEEEHRVWAEAAAAGIADRVRIVSKVRDMPGLISACAVTALVPAQLDSKMDLPMVVLEALALDRPVLIGDHSPMREALFDGGLAVPYGKIERLSMALAQLLASEPLRHHLARRGRKTMLEHCDPASTVASYQQIYHEVLEAP